MMNTPAFGFPVQISKETDDALQHGLKYLKHQQEQGVNRRFWRRFGKKPLFKNKKILELGCGFGGLSLDLALSGAQKVVGLEIDPKDIRVARTNLQKNHPELMELIRFEQVNIADFPEADFDVIVSKDVFEHVDGLEEVLGEIKKRLKIGGCMRGLAPCGIVHMDFMETMKAGISRINILGDICWSSLRKLLSSTMQLAQLLFTL
jgi:2-polyprenyl-3-methyl-5-hydroxy-6-metoxy-1,4-benzoquinol methylase